MSLKNADIAAEFRAQYFVLKSRLQSLLECHLDLIERASAFAHKTKIRGSAIHNCVAITNSGKGHCLHCSRSGDVTTSILEESPLQTLCDNGAEKYLQKPGEKLSPSPSICTISSETEVITRSTQSFPDVIVMKPTSQLSRLQKFGRRSYFEEHPYMDVLLKFPLFASFPQHVIELISRTCFEMKRSEGQTVIQKGEESAEIFFLLKGVVSVIAEDKPITDLHPVSFFGELGVPDFKTGGGHRSVFKFKRSATVVAKTNCVILVVMKHKVDEAIENSPEAQASMVAFSKDKDKWWQSRKYVNVQQKFGGEFAQDIARKRIGKLSMFADAPSGFLDSLAMKITCLEFKAGQTIINVDEESDAIYFILSGSVEVVGSGGIVHAEMDAGAFFGEVGVLLNIKRTATIRAKTEEAHIFKLAKSDLEHVTTEFPEMQAALAAAANERYALYQQRRTDDQPAKVAVSEKTETQPGNSSPDQFDLEVAGQSLRKLRVFRAADASVFAELAQRMQRKLWKPQEKIITCGDIGDSIYFLAAGTVEVITEFGVYVEKLKGPESYFGEVAIFEEVPRIATIECVTSCSTYELKKKDFLEVMANYPQIHSQVRETARERMQQKSSHAIASVLDQSLGTVEAAFALADVITLTITHHIPCAEVEELKARRFAKQTLKITRSSTQTLLAALTYTDRYFSTPLKQRFNETQPNIHSRVFLAVLMTGHKYCSDTSLMNCAWMEVCGDIFTIAEINTLERDFLGVINYGVIVEDEETQARWLDTIQDLTEKADTFMMVKISDRDAISSICSMASTTHATASITSMSMDSSSVRSSLPGSSGRRASNRSSDSSKSGTSSQVFRSRLGSNQSSLNGERGKRSGGPTVTAAAAYDANQTKHLTSNSSVGKAKGASITMSTSLEVRQSVTVGSVGSSGLNQMMDTDSIDAVADGGGGRAAKEKKGGGKARKEWQGWKHFWTTLRNK
ncbi:hypothetical protein HDU83_001949 [Entophlyctis luteolus]|nr:hypothetical protein HDU83_001949 [Entophlyctis luteolus]